jgi:hypothetical protein
MTIPAALPGIMEHSVACLQTSTMGRGSLVALLARLEAIEGGDPAEVADLIAHLADHRDEHSFALEAAAWFLREAIRRADEGKPGEVPG